MNEQQRKAMELAIEALEELNNTKSYWWQEVDPDLVVQLGDAETTLQKALAKQPAQQEPTSVTYKEVADTMNCLWHGDMVAKQYAEVLENKKLYISQQPAKRTWVGLTDREKSNLWLESRAAIPRFYTYASLVEAQLKAKNT